MNVPATYKEEALRNAEAEAAMTRYCHAHPRSPSARRRPRIFFRGQNCIVLLGSTLQDGVAGIGGSIESALRAFDLQYAASVKRSRE